MQRRLLDGRPRPLMTSLLTLLLWIGGCPGEPVDDDTTAPGDDDTTAGGDDDTTEAPPDCVPVQGEQTLDPYGGDERVDLQATGFFRTEPKCDRWWLVTPEGHPFVSIGVNNVTPYGDVGQDSGVAVYRETVEANYPSLDDWADAAAARLSTWGFNTAGCWSNDALINPRMPHTYGLSLAGDDWVAGTVSDYFDPAWEAEVIAATAGLAERADDPNLIGYFLDNEVRWGPDWRGTDTLLQLYLEMAATAPGKAAAVQLLLGELGDVGGVNAALGTSFTDEDEMLTATDVWDALDYGSSATEAALTTAFLESAAERYFQVTPAAVRAADPNHLVLGNREVSVTTRLEVYLAADPHVDLFSINDYVFFDVVVDAALAMSGSVDPADGFAALHAVLDRPILVTEYGFRADDSGMPNSWPPQYPTLATQEERADAFEEYARLRQEIPWIVGYHWFEWVDQPPDGRFDGEDNNWGLVSQLDEPYTSVVERTTAVNPDAWSFLEVPAR